MTAAGNVPGLLPAGPQNAGEPQTRAPRPVLPLWRRLRSGLFGSWGNTAISLFTVLALFLIVPPVVRWAIIDATWTGTAEDCAAGSGACWAFVAAKFRFISFAFYPPSLQWRPALVVAILLLLLLATMLPRLWRWELLFAWIAGLAACWVLMTGRLTPPAVSSNQWGGIPVTLLVWTVCFGTAMPLAILLALARQSKMRGIRALAVTFIEVMRAVPMVAILYVAMLILPMALPNGQLIDKIVRAMIMITLFWSAYIAEVVRAGLQAVPPGQDEAAVALGLRYWQRMQLVVLPQALRTVVPAIVNLAIGFLLATSLLAVIGITDLLNAARAAATDPNWLGFYDEGYIVVATLFFVFCTGGSRYSRWLERHLNSDRARD